MKIRAWHGALVFSVALAGCGRRTTDATDSTVDAPPVAAAPETPEAAPEDSSHDASPTAPEDAGAEVSPAAERPPETPPEVPLSTRDIEKAVGELAAWARKKGGTLGAVVLDVRDGRRIADVNGRVPVNPASNQKILTAAAALHYLGPAYRFRTELKGSVKEGAADALVLGGNGDPSLGTQDLWRLARVARERGLSRVGTVYVDQSFFDDQFVPPAFEQQPNEWAAFRAPVSAVSVEQNTVTLNVVPNAPGSPASVWFEPPGVLEAGGTVETRPRGSGDKVGWVLSAQGSGGAARLRSEVSGGLGADLGRQRYRRRLDDPRLAPGYALQQVLRDLGVEVRGEVQLGKKGTSETLSYLASEPLAQLLFPVGKDSDNFYAETVLKAVGAAAATGDAAGKPATSAEGAQALLRWLERSRIDTAGVVIKNGSGLFDANRVSPTVLAEALAAAYREPAIASEMVAQLAIGGVDGTLRNRFKRFAGTRAVRAKTGTLRDVIALSGYVLAPHGRPPVAFSLVVVGVPAEPGEARRRSDRVVEEIVSALWPASPQKQ